MDLISIQTDAAVLVELGRRLARRRIELGMTQARLAKEAGVGKRTVERIEAGGSAQLSSLVRVLRALGGLDRLIQLIPDEGPSPLQLLKAKKKERKRASSRRGTKRVPAREWTWGDES